MSNKEYTNADELPAILGSMKHRREGFEVPDGYFEHLADNLIGHTAQSILHHREQPEVVRRRVSAYGSWYVGMAAAAILVGVLLATWLFVTTPSEVQVPSLAEVQAKVTPQDIDEYVLSNLDDFEEYLLEYNTTDAIRPSADPSTWDIPQEELNDFLEQLDESDLNEWL